VELTRLQNLVASLSATDIHENLKAFYVSVRLACEASYDAIQIHCAHGYFLSLLLDPRIKRERMIIGQMANGWRHFSSRSANCLSIDPKLACNLALRPFSIG
jgi:NADH:flavin oxidoreductase/NADH oxidase family protein